tara:strand:- start:2252 stop:3262 length:1011 start_codon:yes stop_codon:yes gene_type:complete
MIEVKYISIDEAEKLKFDSLNPFQEIFWWKTIEKGFNKHCKVALILDNDENLFLLPLFFHKIGPILRVGSPLRGTFTPYIGFIWLTDKFDNNRQGIYLKHVVMSLVELGVNWIELSFNSKNNHFSEGLEDLRFVNNLSKTIILNIEQDESRLWMGMQGRSRNLVRKAEKFGLQVKFLEFSIESVDLFYSLLENTFKKSGQKPPHSKAFYQLLIQKLIATNNLIFLSIIKDANVVAMGVFLYNSEEMHFISGTSTAVGNKYAANNLMHWEVIKFALRNNIKKYDFGGLGISSIDKFKKSFGGGEGAYINYIWMTPRIRFLFNLFTWAKSKFPFLNIF